MNDSGREQVINDELSVLYELSLAIEGRLSPVESCRGFLTCLKARQPFSRLSVWLKADAQPASHDMGFSLLYTDSEKEGEHIDVVDTHPFVQALKSSGSIIVESDAVALFSDEWGMSAGRYFLYPLAGLGVLEMQVEPASGSLDGARCLDPVLERFALSLVNALSHEQLQESVEQLRAREKRHQTLIASVEYAQDAIIVSDMDARIQYVNPAFEKMTGYSVAEATGQYVSVLRSGKHPDSFYVDMLETVRQGDVWRGEMIIRCKDGSLCHVERNVAPVFDESGNILCQVNIQRDITGQKNMEEKLLHAQKMESLGTMVGGVAHEFNNALAGMAGRLFMLKSKLPESSSGFNDIDVVEKLCFRSADMVKQMLAFARKSPLQMSLFDLTCFVQETFELNRLSVPENICVSTSFTPHALQLHGDKTHIQQIVVNLLSNARDAVQGSDNPEICMDFGLFEPDDAFLQLHPDAAGKQFACLSVSDNGCGIAEDQLVHLFDPFYTTKEVGEGTGLGLSMLHGACAMHGGYVDVESRLGEGTSVYVYLPVAEPVVQAMVEPGRLVIVGQGETILLVDDDEMLRGTGVRVLNRLGYEVLEAEDGVQALELFESHHTEISLVMMDVVMPRMGGVEAAKHMQQIRSEIPMIFCTGYDKSNVLAGSGIRDELVVSKPFSMALISRKIRECLAV